MAKADLDPWRVISACLFTLPAWDIPKIIERTGLRIDWDLTEKQNISSETRKAAFRPRIHAASDKLSKNDRLRVVFIVADELTNREMVGQLNADLENIGWQIEGERLVPVGKEVVELFFPKNTQHDAYVEIRSIIQEAKSSITVIDGYLDSSIFTLLAGAQTTKRRIRLLTSRTPTDFVQEAKKFLVQYNVSLLEIRKTVEFHDRFLILDETHCWHIGCSIKDAGSKTFMMSKLEDGGNRNVLLCQLNKSWSNATLVAV